MNFYYINIVDQICKIPTIVEILVTVVVVAAGGGGSSKPIESFELIFHMLLVSRSPGHPKGNFTE